MMYGLEFGVVQFTNSKEEGKREREMIHIRNIYLSMNIWIHNH